MPHLFAESGSSVASPGRVGREILPILASGSGIRTMDPWVGNLKLYRSPMRVIFATTIYYTYNYTCSPALKLEVESGGKVWYYITTAHSRAESIKDLVDSINRLLTTALLPSTSCI